MVEYLPLPTTRSPHINPSGGRMLKKISTASLLALAAFSISACNSKSNVTISGAGSTFVNPVMQRWVADFSQGHPTVQINYQSIGSGGGMQQVKSKTVDF